MSGEIERAKLFTVSGPVDNPVKGSTEISVMFNPATLKVTLANTLKENERNGNSRAAQYVDKSSSSLTVELIFDSSIEIVSQSVRENPEPIDVRKDVRRYTGVIANEFMQQDGVGDEDAEPKRCMFAWGTFVFVGIMESFDETLEMFSWEGTPLRATVAIKMTESRYQFTTEEAKAAARDTPQLGRESASPQQANQDAGKDAKNWRSTSLYNGIESPRMPSLSALAVPSLSASANLSVAGGFSAGASFGTSSSLGTAIPGAFSHKSKTSSGLTAGSIMAVSSSPEGVTTSTSYSTGLFSSTKKSMSGRASAKIDSSGVKTSGSLGFD